MDCHMCSFLKNGMMPIVQLTLVLVTLSCSRISGEFCSMGFPEKITSENSTMELDILPEDTEVIIPSLRMTCDGYISHVSVAYEVSHHMSSFNEGVYLQLWRTSGAQAVGMQNYSLVEEVLLPVGHQWPDYDNQSILDNYELPVRITVQSNDIIGFRTPFGSPVEVLVDTTEEREVLSNNDVLNVTGVPQVMFTNRKTCNSRIPNNINVSADAQRGFPVQSVSGNAQILFPSINFTCNGIINQITSWYQIIAGAGSSVSFIEASIKFQIWHPISNSNYKLVSEATVPSALDDQPIAVDNLQLRFYSGSIIGIFIELIRHNGPVTLSLLTSDDTPQSFLRVTNTKPCTFDTTSPGVLRFTTIDAVAVLDYDIISEDMDPIFLCDQDDDDDSIVSSKKKIISAISAAVALVVTITLMILLGVCCWRRWKSSARTKSRYNLLPVENSDDLRSFENIQYYCLDSNPKVMSLSSKSRSYEVINDSTSTTSLFKFSASNFEQICSELTEVELNPDEIEIGDEIGSGHFGVVHRGVWNHIGKADQVAIKTLHDEVLEEERTKLLREAATVQQFLHINIIKFYGVITSRERIMVVLEYLPNGNLLDFLTSANSKKDEQLLPEILLTFAREIASGMNYLSNKSFVHRDLAARNILLSEENVCKIADFGLSRDLDEDDYYIAHGGFIPVKWTAPETIIKIIEGGGDPECRDKLNNTPLHTLVKAKFSDDNVKLDCIVALLAYGGCDPDSKTADEKTALHLAVEARDHLCASTLIVFGAEVSLVNQHGDTPLDIAEEMGLHEIAELIQTSIDYDTQQARIRHSTARWPPTFCRRSSYKKLLDCPADVSTKREVYIQTLADTFEKFKGKIDQTTLDELLACAMETFDYTVQQEPVGRRQRNGDRVLCLDGGGIKGLVLVEILSCIEEVTGKKIIDLFDWFVGTSTGAILALALVYTNLSLHEMRCLYFKLKDEVFSEQLVPIPHGNTEAMERILKSTFGEHRKLGSKTYPKVLVTATDVEYIPWQLVFYNNIEDGPVGKDAPIWMAARATSAAPAFFKQFGKYVDGGLKANNPSMSALTRIHRYYSDHGKKNYKISCVVSLGCGKFRKQTQSIDIRQATSKENFTLWRTVTLKAAGTLAKSVMNLFQALTAEVTESDGQPVNDARAFCEANKISYYRLSPDLNEMKEEVSLNETNSRMLLQMLMLTKWDLLKETTQLHGIKRSTAIPLNGLVK